MGWLDRLRGGRTGPPDIESEEDTGPPPALDVPARSEQLVELDDALRALARAMSADRARMRNPGWAGRVADYRAVAAEAAALHRDGFDRAALTDLASQVVPLSRAGGQLPEEYVDLADQHDRVMAAVDALRAVPPSEESEPSS